MSLQAMLQRWQTQAEISENILEWRLLEARPPETLPLPDGLQPSLAAALAAQGINELFTHQRAAWEHIQSGKHIVLATGTASGKTLAYNLPVLDDLLRHPDASALYLFPTKALAQDQLQIVQNLLDPNPSPAGGRGVGVRAGAKESPLPAIYDGDTPANRRQGIRAEARLVFSNPDMLHTGILPHHTGWMRFLGGLKYVVVDEMHTYRGVFGSHVANVLRRLRRVADFYGARPLFILTSATIANPLELAERLVEAPVELIDQDGSGRGQKHFLIYNPPIVDEPLGIRRGVVPESARLAEDLITYDVQSILFARTRRSVEIILAYLQEFNYHPSPNIGRGVGVRGEGVRSASASPIRGYRSGYLPAQRREIERGLRSGEVRQVVATNALELGIDIGGMDAVLMAGYPGSIAATWQQAGRAGRGEDQALSILVASANPLDQFLARHPEYFFGRSPEAALINPDHILILLGHIRCAAFELPFQPGEAFGSVDPQRLGEYLDYLQVEGALHRSGGKYFWVADGYPAQSISLRSSSPDNFVLSVDSDGEARVIGQVDAESALWMVHPGAVYIHEAQTFLVQELDLEEHIARMEPFQGDYYTMHRSETEIQLIERLSQGDVPGGSIAYGELLVTSQVKGYRKIRWQTQENLGFYDLDLPATHLNTCGYWLTLADETVDALVEAGLWNSARNDYGPGWSRQRDLARARDGFRCQVCGVLEQERAHDVHHRLPFRMFESAEQANQLSNLVTLCPTCHRRAESAVRVRGGLAGLAFALADLAALFLMCDQHDLGVHTDPQSPLGEGRPVIVIYDQAPAGIGFSQRLYEIHADLLSSAAELIRACECADGCPSCVGPGGEFGQGAKPYTLALLEKLT